MIAMITLRFYTFGSQHKLKSPYFPNRLKVFGQVAIKGRAMLMNSLTFRCLIAEQNVLHFKLFRSRNQCLYIRSRHVARHHQNRSA